MKSNYKWSRIIPNQHKLTYKQKTKYILIKHINKQLKKQKSIQNTHRK